MITVRSWAVYGMLAAIWAALIGWQVAEHIRQSRQLHDNLIERCRARSNTCAKLMRAPGFSRSMITTERLEAALNALIDTNDLLAVELLNKSDELVANVPAPIDLPPKDEFIGGVYWRGGTVILKYPIDLGTNMAPELVIPWEEWRAMRTNRPAADSNNPVEASLSLEQSASPPI